MENILNIENVYYQQILEDLSLKVRQGEKVVVKGESGSGKTTFLKILNRLLAPDQGRVIYRERRVESYEIWELRRNITLLFQEPRLFTGTIREELLWPFGLKHSLEVKPGEKRLEEILEICGLNKSPDNPTETLSGGEKQRVCLARTLLMNPDIILLDEPTSALNRELAEKVVESIFKKYQDKTFIIVTHSEEILSRSDTVLEMKDGKLHKKGAGQ